MRVHILKAFATASGSWAAGMRCEIPDADAERYIRAGLVERDEPTIETPERGRIRFRKATKEEPDAGS
jgi:hypothetical protein